MTRRQYINVFTLITLALCLSQATAAIMAIDLGSEFLKISLVKPGRIPITIVNNEMSKRKSPAAVAFVNGDRLVGDEAAALSVRFPDKVFTRVRDLLGRRYDDPAIQRMVKESRLPFTIVQAPNRTTVAVSVQEGSGGETIYTAEELVASLLEYAKKLARDAAEDSAVTDCVLVVPAFWTPAQRRALLDAADLAGLNVMSLIHTHSAAALQYGIERDFTNKTEDVIFYDLGSGSAEAALVRFSSYPSNAKSPSGTAISQFEVKDVAWVEHGVGCDALETALVEHIANQYKGGAEAVLSVPRAVAKLRKQVKRTKEVLSANSDAHVSVEELLSGEDFRGQITREEFENLVPDVWHRAVAPVVSLMKRNNLTAHALSAVELLGGCSRVPRVKSALIDALGGRGLDMHIDADEGVVLGAGLFAANLSTIFRLRKFGMTDKSPYTVLFSLEGADEKDQSETESSRVLVPALRKIPTKRAIALHNLTVDTFSVSLEYENSVGAALPCCEKKEALGTFVVQGIAAVVAKHGYSGKVALHTAVDHSGVFSVDRADASVDVEEEVKIKVPPVESGDSKDTAAATNKNNTTVSSSTIVSSEPNTTDTASTSTPDKKEQREEITKKYTRTIRIPLNVTGSFVMSGLSTEQRLASRKVLRLLRERDEAKRATDKARNDLESYIISTREKLDSSKTFAAFSSEEQRTAIAAALTHAEDWLYGDEGEKATAFALKDKLKNIRKGGDEIEVRAAEKAARPAAIKAAMSFIQVAEKATNSWPTNKPWLNETEVAAVVKSVEDLKAWIESKNAEQEALADHDDPVLWVVDISKKVDPVRKAFNRLNAKPKPIEKIDATEVAEEDKGNDTQSNNSRSSGGDDGNRGAADGDVEASRADNGTDKGVEHEEL